MRTFAGASSSPCWESNASVQAAAGGRAHSLLLAAGPIARAVPSKRRTASRARLQPTVGIARSAHQRWPSRVISIVAKRSPGSAASCIPVPTQTCGQRRERAQRMPRCRHAQRRCPGCRCWGEAEAALTSPGRVRTQRLPMQAGSAGGARSWERAPARRPRLVSRAGDRNRGEAITGPGGGVRVLRPQRTRHGPSGSLTDRDESDNARLDCCAVTRASRR
jgi:hypothetical protein